MGFNMLFYIIFGTNLLTGGPVLVSFCIFSCFAEKEYQTESTRNETFGRVIFWNKRDPGDLECASRNKQGGHKAGGAPTPLGAPPILWPPRGLPDFHPKSPSLRLFQERSSRRFRSVWIPFDIPFL